MQMAQRFGLGAAALVLDLPHAFVIYRIRSLEVEGRQMCLNY